MFEGGRLWQDEGGKFWTGGGEMKMRTSFGGSKMEANDRKRSRVVFLYERPTYVSRLMIMAMSAIAEHLYSSLYSTERSIFREYQMEAFGLNVGKYIL